MSVWPVGGSEHDKKPAVVLFVGQDPSTFECDWCVWLSTRDLTEMNPSPGLRAA